MTIINNNNNYNATTTTTTTINNINNNNKDSNNKAKIASTSDGVLVNYYNLICIIRQHSVTCNDQCCSS